MPATLSIPGKRVFKLSAPVSTVCCWHRYGLSKETVLGRDVFMMTGQSPEPPIQADVERLNQDSQDFLTPCATYECLDPAQQHLPLAMLGVDAGEDGNQIAPPMQAVRGGTLIDTVKGILTWLRPSPSKPWVGWKTECLDLTSGVFD